MSLKQRITIKDVAQKAGVSTQTVSRVINYRPDVSPETRERVQRVIKEMGYSPNVIARSLSRGRTNTLGVVGFGLEYFGSTSVLTGIEQKSNELGFSLLLSLIDKFETLRIDEIVGNLLSRRVDGIIWAVPGNDRTAGQVTGKFERFSVPVVFLNKVQCNDDIVVAMDNRLGGRLATEHLLEQGYQRVGIITGPPTWWEAQEREIGWTEVVRAHGTDDPDAVKVNGDWSAASGDVGLHTLMAKSPDIDAVFASNDQMALGALQAARRLGIKVPEELGIVGFDDIPEAPYFYPSLTTVRQNARALGALAVDQMCNAIQSRQEDIEFKPDVAWVSPKLVVRKSSIRK
jgi:DNA-binding LacI/PurR family transcriptional regulator